MDNEYGEVIMIGKSKQKRVSWGQNSKLCMLDTTEYLGWKSSCCSGTLINPTAGVFIFREAESPRSEPERNFFFVLSKEKPDAHFGYWMSISATFLAVAQVVANKLWNVCAAAPRSGWGTQKMPKSFALCSSKRKGVTNVGSGAEKLSKLFE